MAATAAYILLFGVFSMEVLINSLLSVALVILLGYIAGKTGLIRQENDHSLNVFILNFSLPILLFIAAATAKPEQLLDWRIGGAFAVGLLGMYALVLLLNRFILRRSLARSAETAFVCGYPNTAFLGIPLMMSIVGMPAMLPIVISNIIVGVIMIPLTLILIEISVVGEGRVNFAHIARRIFKNPLIFMPVLGILISLLHIQIPKAIESSAHLIGGTTSGVSLFTLGLIMSRFKICISAVTLLNIFLKNIFHPILMVGVVHIFGITGLLAKELIILCAMPTAVTATIFSITFDLDPIENVSSTIFGTIFSLITLLGFMYYLHF
jgi:malonate transporter